MGKQIVKKIVPESKSCEFLQNFKKKTSENRDNLQNLVSLLIYTSLVFFSFIRPHLKRENSELRRSSAKYRAVC